MNEICTDHLWLYSSVSEDEEEEEASYYYCKLPQVPGSRVDGERESVRVYVWFSFSNGFSPLLHTEIKQRNKPVSSVKCFDCFQW
jgi:hypothetical protein